VVEAAHHSRRLQPESGIVLGCPLSLGAGGGERRDWIVGAGALSALISKYLEGVIAAEQSELESSSEISFHARE